MNEVERLTLIQWTLVPLRGGAAGGPPANPGDSSHQGASLLMPWFSSPSLQSCGEKIKVLLFEPPRLGCFVTATHTDWYTSLSSLYLKLNITAASELPASSSFLHKLFHNEVPYTLGWASPWRGPQINLFWSKSHLCQFSPCLSFQKEMSSSSVPITEMSPRPSYLTFKYSSPDQTSYLDIVWWVCTAS